MTTTTGFTNVDQFLALFKGVKPYRDGWKVLCPGHEDHNPSLKITLGEDGKILLKCFAGCDNDHIVKSVGLKLSDLFLNKDKKGRIISAVYNYQNKDGKTIYQVCRTMPKGFYQRRHDGNNGFIYDLKGVTPIIYHLPDILKAIDSSEPIQVINEGEKDCDNCFVQFGIPATCNSGGAGKWKPEFGEYFKGAQTIVVIADKDQPGRDHAKNVADSLVGKVKTIKVIEMPGDGTKDLSDWIEQGGDREAFLQLVNQVPEYKRTIKENPAGTLTLEEVLNKFRSHYELPDTGHIEIMFGDIAANYGDGDPVWLIVVAPPSYGKTEPLNSLIGLPNIHPVGVLTEASLLSGTPRKDMAKDAKGGLLAEMGNFGVIIVKDFSGMLTLQKDSRGPILAALREVYDGAWTRYVGIEGGRKLHWQGKCGLLGAATPNIDQHYAVMASLGERFCFYRMQEGDETKRAQKALDNAGHENEIRVELNKAVFQLFNGVTFSKGIPALSQMEKAKIVALAHFATRCRSVVERDTYSNREILLVPGAESATRFVKVLALLFRGLLDIGSNRERAWELITKVALDSLPAFKCHVLKMMLEHQEIDKWTTTKLSTELHYPSNTTRRALEDLNCYGIVLRSSQGQGNPDLWHLSDWTRQTYGIATTLPEIWEGGI